MSIPAQFPIGKFVVPEKIDAGSVKANIAILEAFPQELQKTLAGVGKEKLSTKTAPGLWTVAQVVNHIADSHTNMVVRVKLALTEDNPTITPYNESLWAKLPDGSSTDISNSLSLIEALHGKLTRLLYTLGDDELKRTYYHPADNKAYAIGTAAALYAWHGNHHLAFIKDAIASR